MATLYGHYQPLSNKWYIGIVLGDRKPENRWGENGHSYIQFKNGKPLHPKFRNAILKYGWDSFEHIIFFNNLTDEQAKKIETEYIIKYNSVKNGYNCTYGGDGIKGYKFSNETRKRMSIIAKNNKEKLEKLRLSRIGRQSAISKPVICIETGEIYPSARQASISIGLNTDAVKTAIHRNGKCKNMHWEFIIKFD